MLCLPDEVNNISAVRKGFVTQFLCMLILYYAFSIMSIVFSVFHSIVCGL